MKLRLVKVHSKVLIEKGGSFMITLLLSYIITYHIVNSVCCSHARISGPTLKRPTSEGGLCSGQLLVM